MLYFIRSKSCYFLGLFILFALMGLGSESTSQEIKPPARDALDSQADAKVYVNEKFGYTLSYPANWFPSETKYANAFEIRNYSPKDPASMPERNRASIVILTTSRTVTVCRLATCSSVNR